MTTRVMARVSFAQAAQNRDRLLDARLFDHHRLEAAFECGIRFDVLAVLIEGRRADALQFAAREFGLDHRGEVERTFGGAGADERVQLVDEEHDVARAALDLVENALDAAFELAAIFRAGNQRPEREREHFLVAQRRGHVPGDDALREAFDDRRFADAGLADQHGIVLAAARENRDDAFDFVVASDDRIELAGAREIGEIARILRQGRRAAAQLLPELVDGIGRAALPLHLLGEIDAAGDDAGGRHGGAQIRQGVLQGNLLRAGGAEQAPAIEDGCRLRTAVLARIRRIHLLSLPRTAERGFTSALAWRGLGEAAPREEARRQGEFKNMGILAWIVFGLIVGIVAKWIVPGSGFGGVLGDIIVGIIGAFLGGWIYGFFAHVGVTGFNIPSMVCALVGAVVLLFIVRALSGSRAAA